MGRGPDLPKGRRQQIRILELSAVSGLVCDRRDLRTAETEIGQFAFGEGVQFGGGGAVYFPLCCFVGELGTEGGKALFQ